MENSTEEYDDAAFARMMLLDALMNHLELLHKWELPVLLGTSRKSMIGLTLDLPVTEREEGTIATSVMGLMKGCQFFRVHNVKGNARALQMAWAIMHS